MPLVTLQDIFLSYGQPPLIDHINLVIEPGERVCLIGRNGAGKSTLLKILTGQITADDGVLKRACRGKDCPAGTVCARGCPGQVFDVITQGLGAEGELANATTILFSSWALTPATKAMRELEECQSELEQCQWLGY